MAPPLAMARQMLKTSCAKASFAQAARTSPKGLRSLQRSTGPFADSSLCLLLHLILYNVAGSTILSTKSMSIKSFILRSETHFRMFNPQNHLRVEHHILHNVL
jgi:hypothetical protein